MKKIKELKNLSVENTNSLNDWNRIGPVQKINHYSWEYGHPVYSESGALMGYAANTPSYEGEEVEFIDLKGASGVLM